MSKTVVVDIGNYNYKYAGLNIGMFSSRYSRQYNPYADAYERIEYNSQTTYIGLGDYEREYSKADKDIVPQTLYAISKATTLIDVNLCLLMPLNQLPKRQQLINKFLNQGFKFAVNSKERNINIKNCAVLPECQAAYYSLEKPSDFQMLIDIGSRTINWACWENGKLALTGTERLGVYDFYNNICVEENAKGEDYTVEQIEGQIKRGRIKVDNSVYSDFLKLILNRIKASVNIKNYDVMFLGGGSLMFKDIIEAIPNVGIHPNPMYANVIGAYVVCERMW